MRFDELQTLASVKDGAAGSSRTNFRASDGWELSFEQGIVTIRKGEIYRVMPWNGVAWATPAKGKSKGDIT